ncbi:MAG: Lrp/AsnC family transcriptional regulator [Candidatus Hermodarchaeota archaeon]
MNQKEIVKILKKLNTKSKPKISIISKELMVTRQTFRNRFDYLRKEKIINNFTININPNIRPKLMHIIIEIKTNPKEPKLVEELLLLPQLRLLDGIFGEYSLIALFEFKDSEEFNSVLKKIDEIMAYSYFKKYQIIETIKAFKINGIELASENVYLNQLERIEYSILEILQYFQGIKPISTYDIKQSLKKRYNLEISQPSIYNKIKKLEETGIILNHTLNFCPIKIGFKGKYIVRIKPKDPSRYDSLALNLEKKKEITDLFRIGEQYGLFAIVRVNEIEDYSGFIKELYDTEEIEDTFTNFVLDELKPYTNYVIY